jgi:hypothetical protein
MKILYKHLNNFMLTHSVNILIFSIIYYYLLSDMDKYFVLNNKEISKSFYNNNKILNAVFIAVNLETSTGYIELVTNNTISRGIVTIQMFLSLLITLNTFRLILI